MPRDPLLEQIDAEYQAILDRVFSRPDAPSDNGGPPDVQFRWLRQLLEEPHILEPPTAIIPRVAYRGYVTLLAGREKMGGKSTFVTAGAAAVTAGTPFLGEATSVGAVIWVSADQEHAAQITQRAQRFGADPDRFGVLWPQHGFADLAAVLATLHPPPVLIVIDTLAHFSRGQVRDPFSSADWPAVLMPLIELARTQGIAIVIIHHAKKAEGGGYRDSGEIGAAPDAIMEIVADATHERRRQIKVLARWSASPFVVELGEDGYSLVGGAAVSLDARILAFVTSHPQTAQGAIREAMGARAREVDAAVERLVRAKAMYDSGSARHHRYSVRVPDPSLLDPECQDGVARPESQT